MPPTYHDVVVYVANKPYRISDNYAYELTCTRVGGWKLWQTWNGQSALIGGEYEEDPFRIEVAGQVICDTSSDTNENEDP